VYFFGGRGGDTENDGYCRMMLCESMINIFWTTEKDDYCRMMLDAYGVCIWSIGINLSLLLDD
jgi:hypothetical protein